MYTHAHILHSVRAEITLYVLVVHLFPACRVFFSEVSAVISI